jgi:hypothetical protein
VARDELLQIADLWKVKMFHVKHFTLTPTRNDGKGTFAPINGCWYELEAKLKNSESAYEGVR